MLARTMLMLMFGVWAAASVAADPPAGEQSLDVSAIMSQMMGGGPPGGGDEDSPFPKFEEVTKDMAAREGFITLWEYVPAKREKDPEKLLAQIPAAMLGEKFMISTSVSGGGFFTGFPLDERVVKWEILGKQLLLIEPNPLYVVNEAEEVGDVVQRTYPDRIRAAVPILTRSPGGDPVIDLGGLLKSSFADIAWMTGGFGPFGGFGGGGGGINPMLSKWTKKKTFPQNTEMGVELAIAAASPPGSYDKTLVHYSFWKLPNTNYQSRVADDRVGYFLTANQDWAKPSESRDLFNRYIDRWQLEKRDPSLKLCEPKQPIVFYIEKTVPVQYRRAVRDGILDWNKAYEKVGFVNAVEVRQQTDDNEWKDYDPEDMRYSFFRWIVTGAGFAMGPHRANPFTGQIYDADIIFDDSMVRFYEQQIQQSLPSALTARKLAEPALQDFFAQHPQWARPVREWEETFIGEKPSAEVRQQAVNRLRERGRFTCDYIEGMKHQMAVAGALMAGQPREVVDRFLYEVVKEVVMHEVGHTLGLRHNFKASTIYTLDQMRERSRTGQPTVGSVMDYNPAMFFADADLNKDLFITPTIGPYDHWAIEYGYRPFDGSYQPEGDAKNKEETGQKKSDEKAAASSTPAATSAKLEGSVNDIPKEILEKLPPEVRKMMESGDAAALAKMAGAQPGGGSSGSSPAGPPSGEEGMLRTIAGRCNEPELAYATDEDASFLAPDPTVNRFDAGADPLEWAKARMALINQRMENILEWAVKDQESWYYLRGAFGSLTFEKANVLDYVGRYIGGQYYNRNHRGDKDETTPFTLVSVERQREAMGFIEDNLFADKFFNVDPKVLNHLAVPRWYHNGATINNIVDFPIHDVIATIQWWNLFDRLFPNTLRRIHDAEMKTNGSDTFTLAEYIQRVQKSCWGGTNAAQVTRGTWTDTQPFVSAIRRSLQREYLGLIEPLVRSQPGTVVSPDIHAMVRYAVRKLGDDLDETIKSGKADFASQAHLVSCKSRIERMLEPELNELGGGGMGGLMFGRETGK